MKEDTHGSIKRVTAVVFLLLFSGLCIMLYCEWRGNIPDTLYVCRKMLWVMPASAVLIGMAHYKAGKGVNSREYILQMLCGKNTAKDRKFYLDYARVFAAVMVILTHACSMQANEEAALWKTNLLLFCESVGLICNPLYVMISGALLLSSEKEEPLGTFYWKRFLKVAVPMVVYYVIFLCVSGQISLIPPQNLKEGALQILAGPSGIVPHYWLIYTLLSLYVTAPFLRIMVKNLQDSYLNALFFLILAEEALVTCLPLAGVQTGFAMNLADWEGVFILGYLFTERRTRMMERIVLAGGIISAAFLPLVWIFHHSLRDYVTNTAPVTVLFAGAVLILLSKLDGILRKKFQYVILALSKYSYPIILAHWYGLFVVTWGKIGIQPLRFGCVGGIALTVLTAFLVSFILGFTADNTVVLAVQYIFSSLKGALIRLAEKRNSLHVRAPKNRIMNGIPVNPRKEQG